MCIVIIYYVKIIYKKFLSYEQTSKTLLFEISFKMMILKKTLRDLQVKNFF